MRSLSFHLKTVVLTSTVVTVFCLEKPAEAAGIAAYWDSSTSTEYVFYMDLSENIRAQKCHHPDACWVSEFVVDESYISQGTQFQLAEDTQMTSYYDGSQGHLFFNGNQSGMILQDWLFEVKGSPPSTNSAVTTVFSAAASFGKASSMWDGSIGHIFFEDGSSNLQERWFNGSWNASLLPTCSTNWGVYPAAYWDGSVEHVVFNFRDSSNNPGLCETYHANSQWTTHPIAGSGASLPTPNTFMVSGATFNGTQAVLSVNGSSQNNLVLTTYSPWTSIDIPANVTFGSDPLVYADSNGYVYFVVGSNAHLYEMLNPGSRFQEIIDFSTSSFGDKSIVSTTSVNQTIGNITGFFDGTTDHVFYVGSDEQVHEYYAKPGGNWTGHAIATGQVALP